MSDRADIRPNPGPQERFLASTADEVLYGGAAGGGKSYALLLWATFGIAQPEYRCLLLRRTFRELELSLIDESRRIYPYLAGSPGTYNESRHTWTFPSGAQIIFGHCEHEGSVLQYQSAQFARIGIDQVESFTRYQFTYLLSRNRNLIGLQNQMRCTANPGGPGGAWVKKRFIDTCGDGRRRWFLDDEEVPAWTTHARSRQFIPARVVDNPHLMANDPGYVARLKALPARERAQLLEGDWDAQTEGMVYDNWSSLMHLVDPFPVPADWMRFRAIDFGYTNPFVCQWWARSPDDELYLYREIYEPERLVADLGAEIRSYDAADGIGAPHLDSRRRGVRRYAFTVADHDAENRAELNRQGIPTIPAEKAVQEGIQEVRQRLEPRGNGKPRLYVMRGCTVPWRSVKAAYPADYPRSTVEEFQLYRWPDSRENRAEGEEPVDQHNHGMDALRYAVMASRRTGAPARWRSVEGV